MTSNALAKIAKALPLAAVLLAYGCGGGGGSGTTADGGPAPMPPGMGPSGMGPSGMGPSGAGGGATNEGPTLAEAFATQQDQDYSLSTAALVRSSDPDSTSISDTFRITSIQRTEAGGYAIGVEDGDRTATATFLPEHCTATYCEYTDTESGTYFSFWSNTWTENGQPLGTPSQFAYMAAPHLIVGGTRAFFVFGLGTPASAVPATGQATYTGSFRADAYRAGSRSGDFRQRYDGALRLVANFDMSALEGSIFNIRGSAPGASSSSDRVSWPSSSFTITNGRFNNGQFTATLTGTDSDPAVADVESVRGFMGALVAKFFGPNAEEIGGTLTATRDLANTDNDLNLYGFVAGTKLGPPSVLGSSATMVGVNRDYRNRRTEALQDDGTAAVERTDNGWRLSVGGRTFEIGDSEFDADPRFPGNYTHRSSGATVVMGSRTRGLHQDREFDHFDVMGWGTAEPDIPTQTSGQIGYLVYGDRTPASAVPSGGTATYTGRMEAGDYPTDDAVFSSNAAHTRYRGDVTLNADFSNARVTGEFTSLESRPGNGSFSAAAGGATFTATVSGNGIAASDLTGTGALAAYQNGRVRGAFFGPAAEEAAGAFDAQDATNRKALFGYFGTRKSE